MSIHQILFNTITTVFRGHTTTDIRIIIRAMNIYRRIIHIIHQLHQLYSHRCTLQPTQKSQIAVATGRAIELKPLHKNTPFGIWHENNGRRNWRRVIVNWRKQNDQTNKLFVCWLLSFDDDIDFFIILLLFTTCPPFWMLLLCFGHWCPRRWRKQITRYLALS